MKSVYRSIKKLICGKLKRVGVFSMVGLANTLLDFIVFTMIIAVVAKVTNFVGYKLWGND